MKKAKIFALIILGSSLAVFQNCTGMQASSGGATASAQNQQLQNAESRISAVVAKTSTNSATQLQAAIQSLQGILQEIESYDFSTQPALAMIQQQLEQQLNSTIAQLQAALQALNTPTSPPPSSPPPPAPDAYPCDGMFMESIDGEAPTGPWPVSTSGQAGVTCSGGKIHWEMATWSMGIKVSTFGICDGTYAVTNGKTTFVANCNLMSGSSYTVTGTEL